MQDIDKQFHQDAYGHLKHREARLKERYDQHQREQESAEHLRLAQLKLLHQEESEPRTADGGRQRPAELDTQVTSCEAENLRQLLPPGTSLGVVSRTLQVGLCKTAHRSLVAKLQFPVQYPDDPLVTSLQSQTLDPALLEKVAAACNTAANELRGKGGQAAAVALQLIKLVHQNRLAPAYRDLTQLRTLFEGTQCQIKQAKQGCGQVRLHLEADRYHMTVDCVVPEAYPEEPLAVTITGHNLPPGIVAAFCARTKDTAERMARFQGVATDVHSSSARAGSGTAANSKAEQLTMAGKQSVTSFTKSQRLAASAQERDLGSKERRAREAGAFVARPSLFAILHDLYTDCVAGLGQGRCPICEKRLLPSDPNKADKVPKSMEVLRVYCGHYYHYKCVDTYVSEPPFGKRCHTCDAFIEHHLLTTDTKVLEARWASKQAKQRELDEILDFLS